MEAMACEKALALAEHCGVRKITVASDCLSIIKNIKEKTRCLYDDYLRYKYCYVWLGYMQLACLIPAGLQLPTGCWLWLPCSSSCSPGIHCPAEKLLTVILVLFASYIFECKSISSPLPTWAPTPFFKSGPPNWLPF